MKKFLTVLLVIAVMFTFSFGSAFAAVATSEQKTTLATATTLATKQAQANFDLAMDELTGVAVGGYAIADTTLAAQKDAIWTALSKAIADQTIVALEDYTYSGTGSALAASVYGDLITLDGIKAWIAQEPNTAGANVYAKTGFGTELVKAQYALDVAEEVAKYNKIDMTKYSTYADRVSAYVPVLKKAIEDAKVTVETAVAADYAYNIGVLRGMVAGNLTTVYVDGFENQAGYETGLYILSASAEAAEKIYTESTTEIKTAKEEAAEAATGAATAAAIKAEAAHKAATYMVNVSSTNGVADAYTTIISWLADEKVITSSIAAWQGIDAYTAATLTGAVDNVESLKAIASKYTAETNGEGVAVRDAAKVAKIVKKATTDLYALAIGMDAVGYTATYASLNDAVQAIIALNTNDAAYELEFAKEAAKAYLNDLKADLVEDELYYPAEMNKLIAAIDAAIAKVDAVTDATKIDTTTEVFNMIVMPTVQYKTTVDNYCEFVAGTTTADRVAFDAVKTYVTYVNTGKSPLDASYINWDGATVKAAIREVYGEAGARTEAARKAVTVDAAAIAAQLSTVAGLDAAQAAAKDAIKALPATAKIAVSDFAAVKAAYEADDTYKDMNGSVAYTEQATLAADIEALHQAMLIDFSIRTSKVDKTDKAALEALKAEIDAANEEDMFAGETAFATETLTTALNTIRTNELNAVKKAINLLPVNVTEANKAQVEAARDLYDAFVAEYTDYGTVITDAYDAVAAIGAANLRTLEAAEAVLGLNAEDAAYSVEALKITASSKATKGAITVKWTVKGDTSAVEGYEIWKSTKKNSGYKKAFTATKMSYKNTKGLKKGTRYYYKVRAIAYTADGEKVKSDWSNKAYRIAK